MAWKNEIEFKGGWPREIVTVGVDADGDLALMNFEGQAVVIHAIEAIRFADWIMENFAKPCCGGSRNVCGQESCDKKDCCSAGD